MKIKAILPQLFDNSRISVGICWTYLVIAELVASESGIGHMIKEAQRFSKTPGADPKGKLCNKTTPHKVTISKESGISERSLFCQQSWARYRCI
jgi:hypothetical protein